MYNPESFGPFTDGFYETGNQVHEWVIQRARTFFKADDERRETLTDEASAVGCAQLCRKRFLHAIGGLPDSGTDLAVEETSRLKRDGYTIRKLIFQSLPSVYVTANLYVPHDLTGPAPGVLMACGHAREGKAAPKYQQVCVSLVKAGFVVLIIDSPSHGEMLQCLTPGTNEPLVGWNTPEHSYLQLPASILGQNIMRYFIHNARRGLDLLCGLPEVDETRIGMTGNSGGGHLTQAMMLVDPRIKAAASVCSLTTREHYLVAGIRAYDGEQNYFGCIPSGLDYDAFLSGFAPRPLLIGAAAYDYFAIEGVEESIARARRVYRVFGAEDRIELCLAPEHLHGYSAPLRRGCVHWFLRHLQGREVELEEDEPPVEAPETLQCTESGQVLTTFPDARSLLDLHRDCWETLRKKQDRHPLEREELRKLLQLPEITVPQKVRRTALRETETAITERLFFFSEPGIIVTGVLYRPRQTITGATLLLIPDGTQGQEPYTATLIRLLEEGRMVFVFDPRGTGAVTMRTRNTGQGLAFRSTECRVSNDHFLLGTSLASRRAFDVLRALAYLRNRPELTPACPIDLIAHGRVSLYGLIAAAVDGDLTRCEFSGLPESWSEAFDLTAPRPERISESLILPELQGDVDLSELQRLCNAG